MTQWREKPMSSQSLLLIVLVLMLVGAMLYRMPSKRRDFALRDDSNRTVKAGVRRSASAQARPPTQPCPPTQIPLEDWDVLFGAVKARLRQTVDQRLADANEPYLRGAVGRMQAIVLECANALDLLHAAPLNQPGRQQRSERDRGQPPLPQ
jgi:hypothetical protein